MAIRDRDIAAEIIGVRPLRTKLLAFGVSSFYCGVAGAEYVFLYLGSAETLAFDIGLSFLVLFMVITIGVLLVVNAKFERVGVSNLMAGGYLWSLILLALTSLFLKGGSYLFTWPLLFNLSALAFVLARKRRASFSSNTKSSPRRKIFAFSLMATCSGSISC